jgi:hypothetical protein
MSSTTTSKTTVRDLLNSDQLGKATDAIANVPLGDLFSVLLDAANPSVTVSAVTATGAVTPTATGAVTITATAVSAATAVSPASAAYASPDQSILATLTNANRATVNQCVTDIGSIKTKLDAAVVDISALATKVAAATVDISMLRAALASTVTGTLGGATETSLAVSSNTATLTYAASSVISVYASTATTTGVKKLIRNPDHTLATGEVYWDGNKTLKFAAVDVVSYCEVIYSKASGAQKVSCLMSDAQP